MAAEEEVLEEEESAEGGGWRSVLVPMLTSAVTAVLVGAGLYFFVLPKMQNQKTETPSTESGAETESVAALPDLPETPATTPATPGEAVRHSGIYHHYDSFVVSIFDREKVHYLRIKIALELSAAGIADEIAKKDPQIKDSMIFVLGDFTVRELLDNQAKLLVKEVLLKTLNKILGKGKVLDVYFTEFVVQ